MLALVDPELDHGPRTDRSATMRMCAVTRKVRPIDELIRFVVAPTLAADTEALLVRSVVEALAMAAKAGHVISGFSKVEDALRQRQAGALIHASDGAVDGIRKLDAIVRQNAGIDDESNQFPVVTALTSEQLDLALGRSNVIHAALLAGPASKTFLSRSQILVRYRMADDDKTAGHAARNSPIQTVRTRTT